MKTMQDYTAYCTALQTRRAYELGAPLLIASPSEDTVLCEKGIFNTYANCVIPTTQQMIGWLEKEKNIYLVPVIPTKDVIKFEIFDDNKDDMVGTTGVFIKSYNQAELAAIDVVLDYLEGLKK